MGCGLMNEMIYHYPTQSILKMKQGGWGLGKLIGTDDHVLFGAFTSGFNVGNIP